MTTSDQHPDPAFPSLHGRPATGWVNDPNGLAFIDGTYHVFFQHNPDAPFSSRIRWGHASSTDLVSWQQEPIALVPRPGGLDAFGCWSGCVTDDEGVPTAVYSAVPDGSGHADVTLARSDRTLRSWEQSTTPAQPMPDDPTITDARDPYVFSFDGHRYAIQGAGHRDDGPPRILLYRCDDLTDWTPLGSLLTDEDPIAAQWAPATIWECPNLLPLGDRWVLIVSVMGREDGLNRVRFLVGDLRADGDGLAFAPTAGGLVDTGSDYYAPQVLALPDRALIWGWAWEDGRTEEEIAAAGWAGALTFPRELEVVDDRLLSRPAPELSLLRGDPLDAGEPVAAWAFEVESDRPVTIVLLRGEDEEIAAELASGGRVLVDGSLVEAFPADELPATSRTYPDTDSRWVVRGDARVWELRPPQG